LFLEYTFVPNEFGENIIMGDNFKDNKPNLVVVAEPEVASPQVENGFTRIANELYDQIISFKLGRNQLKVILLILRSTYGYQRKHSLLKQTYIALKTGLDPSAVNRAVQELINMNVIIDYHAKKPHEFPEGTYGPQKNYFAWRETEKIDTARKKVAESSSSLTNRQDSVDESSYIKDNIKKTFEYIGNVEKEVLHLGLDREQLDGQMLINYLVQQHREREPVTKSEKKEFRSWLMKVIQRYKLAVDKNGYDKANAILKTSFDNSWNNIFPDKTTTPSNGKPKPEWQLEKEKQIESTWVIEDRPKKTFSPIDKKEVKDRLEKIRTKHGI